MPFEVPEGWVWCNICDITSKITDGTHNSPQNFPKGEYKYITAKNIKTNGVVVDNITYVDKETHQEIFSRCNPELGDILYIKDGATTGVATINNLSEPFSLLSSVALIKPLHCISNRFLCYFLQSDICYASVRESMKGVGITRITLKQIEKWIVPLPPLAEQQRIVTEIDKWFALVDIIEQGKDNLQATITQAKSKILDLAIHGKLVPQDPTDEPAIELLRRINSKFTPCDNGQYGNIPSSWTCCRLSDVANSELGKTLDREKNTGSLHPYLCSINILWNRIDLSVVKEMRIEDSELTKYEVNNGDLLICEGGESGRCAIWDKDTIIYYQNALHRVRFFDNISAKFFMYQLDYMARSRKLDKYTKGVTIKHLTKTALNSIPFVFPPTQEQYRIVDAIERIYKRFEFIQSSIETQ